MYEDIKNDNPKWMKLVDLYNERWKEKWGDDELCFTYEMRFDTAHLISKQMGFIKRLVENDKITDGTCMLQIIISDLEKYECVLMQLSISDNPIQDLIQLLN